MRDIGVTLVSPIYRAAQHGAHHLRQLQGAFIPRNIKGSFFAVMSVNVMNPMQLWIKSLSKTVATEGDVDWNADRLFFNHHIDGESHLLKVGEAVDLAFECFIRKCAHNLQAYG